MPTLNRTPSQRCIDAARRARREDEGIERYTACGVEAFAQTVATEAAALRRSWFSRWTPADTRALAGLYERLQDRARGEHQHALVNLAFGLEVPVAAQLKLRTRQVRIDIGAPIDAFRREARNDLCVAALGVSRSSNDGASTTARIAAMAQLEEAARRIFTSYDPRFHRIWVYTQADLWKTLSDRHATERLQDFYRHGGSLGSKDHEVTPSLWLPTHQDNWSEALLRNHGVEIPDILRQFVADITPRLTNIVATWTQSHRATLAGGAATQIASPAAFERDIVSWGMLSGESPPEALAALIMRLGRADRQSARQNCFEAAQDRVYALRQDTAAGLREGADRRLGQTGSTRIRTALDVALAKYESDATDTSEIHLSHARSLLQVGEAVARWEAGENGASGAGEATSEVRRAEAVDRFRVGNETARASVLKLVDDLTVRPDSASPRLVLLRGERQSGRLQVARGLACALRRPFIDLNPSLATAAVDEATRYAYFFGQAQAYCVDQQTRYLGEILSRSSLKGAAPPVFYLNHLENADLGLARKFWDFAASFAKPGEDPGFYSDSLTVPVTFPNAICVVALEPDSLSAKQLLRPELLPHASVIHTRRVKPSDGGQMCELARLHFREGLEEAAAGTPRMSLTLSGAAWYLHRWHLTDAQGRAEDCFNQFGDMRQWFREAYHDLLSPGGGCQPPADGAALGPDELHAIHLAQEADNAVRAAAHEAALTRTRGGEPAGVDAALPVAAPGNA